MKKTLTLTLSALALAASLQAGQYSSSLANGPKQRHQADRPVASEQAPTVQARQHSMQLQRSSAPAESSSEAKTVRAPEPTQRQYSSQLRKSAS